MKVCLLLSVLSVFAIVLPVVSQDKAHETVIDGRWEATAAAGEQATLFDFINATGTVSGTVTHGGRLMEIKNGLLNGVKLTFETSQVGAGGGEIVKMIWTGTVIASGESIKLTCATEGPVSGGRSQEFEAKRAK